MRLKSISTGLASYCASHDDKYLIPSAYTAGERNDWAAVLVWKEYLDSAHSSAENKLVSSRITPFRCPAGNASIGGGKGSATATYTTGGDFYIHTWYGLNAGTDATYPYMPSNGTKGSYRNIFDLKNVSSTVAAFDGASVHGGSSSNVWLQHLDESVNCVLMEGSVKRLSQNDLTAAFAGTGSVTFPAKFP